MNTPKVLIVDDEESIRKLVRRTLEAENMLVYQAQNGMEALEMAVKTAFDLIILDVMMQGMSGYDVAREIRNRDIRVPIIFLSGRSEEHSIIQGFVTGGDNYITKPFSPAVLSVQVKSHIRRNKEISNAKGEADVVTRGPFVFDQKTYKFYKDGRELLLTSKEAKLLRFFMLNPNQVFTKDQLYQNVWEESIVDDNTIMVYIRHLRSKIEDDQTKPAYILTVWGIGYRFSV